ncbi:hypothetical protein J6590_052821 [Homalodisca vitripennis]|nr:hypothetical protein J6590_052821 [Homalodisca vitripennis]
MVAQAPIHGLNNCAARPNRLTGSLQNVLKMQDLTLLQAGREDARKSLRRGGFRLRLKSRQVTKLLLQQRKVWGPPSFYGRTQTKGGFYRTHSCFPERCFSEVEASELWGAYLTAFPQQSVCLMFKCMLKDELFSFCVELMRVGTSCGVAPKLRVRGTEGIGILLRDYRAS